MLAPKWPGRIPCLLAERHGGRPPVDTDLGVPRPPGGADLLDGR
jgi:hypothetical protein